AHLELPQQLAAARVHHLEPPVQRPVEDDVARRHERATPHGKWLLDAPHLAAGRRIPRDELAFVLARASLLRRVRADVWRAGDVRDGATLEIHAQIVRWHVEQSRLRREGGRLLVLPALEGG